MRCYCWWFRNPKQPGMYHPTNWFLPDFFLSSTVFLGKLLSISINHIIPKGDSLTIHHIHHIHHILGLTKNEQPRRVSPPRKNLTGALGSLTMLPQPMGWEACEVSLWVFWEVGLVFFFWEKTPWKKHDKNMKQPWNAMKKHQKIWKTWNTHLYMSNRLYLEKKGIACGWKHFFFKSTVPMGTR